MPALPVVAAVGAVVAAGATVASAVEAKKARRDAKEQYQFERQLANNQAARRRVDAIRAGRLAQGALLQTVNNRGAANTSAALGGLGSIQSQLNSNLSFLDRNQKLADQAGLAASRVNMHRSKSQLFGQVAGVGMSLFNAGGGFNAFE